jgi:hypothetical protein
MVYRLIYKRTYLYTKCISISVWTFFILAVRTQNVSLKGGKLWKLSYIIKEKLNGRTNNYRDFTDTVVSMEGPHLHFLYSAKAFCSFAMAEA